MVTKFKGVAAHRGVASIGKLRDAFLARFFGARTGLVYCMGIFCALLARGAVASNEFDLSVFAEGARYDSTESLNGSVFDHEGGVLRGAYLHGDYLHGPWRVGVDLRELSNMIEYRGQNQFGIPIASNTDLHYSRTGAHVAYQPFSAFPVFAGLAVGTRGVDRTIQATPITQALHETLRQQEWGPLLGFDWKPTQRLSIVAQAQRMTSSRSTLAVDFLGSYEPGTLNLPHDTSRTLQVSASYDINATVALVLEANGEHFSPATSPYAVLMKNGEPVGLYNYPGSVQSTRSLGIGMRIRW
jgi:hypothetical protein